MSNEGRCQLCKGDVHDFMRFSLDSQYYRELLSLTEAQRRTDRTAFFLIATPRGNSMRGLPLCVLGALRELFFYE